MKNLAIASILIVGAASAHAQKAESYISNTIYDQQTGSYVGFYPAWVQGAHPARTISNNQTWSGWLGGLYGSADLTTTAYFGKLTTNCAVDTYSSNSSTSGEPAQSLSKFTDVLAVSAAGGYNAVGSIDVGINFGNVTITPWVQNIVGAGTSSPWTAQLFVGNLMGTLTYTSTDPYGRVIAKGTLSTQIGSAEADPSGTGVWVAYTLPTIGSASALVPCRGGGRITIEGELSMWSTCNACGGPSSYKVTQSGTVRGELVTGAVGKNGTTFTTLSGVAY